MRSAPLAPFAHVSGVLSCESVSLEAVAEAVGTPTYVYSTAYVDAALAEAARALAWAPHHVFYAVKANGALALLGRIARAGAGADIVSGGELVRALRAGIPPSRIVYSGAGKRDDEIEAALRAPIRALHVESEGELDAIERIADRLGRVGPRAASVVLRLNPDVDPKTHPYIATGLHDTKFGLEIETARALLPRIVASQRLRLDGVACHIGSQIGDPRALRDAVAIAGSFLVECRRSGAPARSLDAGGGWAIAYGDEPEPPPVFADYGAAIRDGVALAGLEDDVEIAVELGRALVGPAGALLTRIIDVKDQPSRSGAAPKRFVVVDAGMNDLLRPALYGAHHGIVPVRAPDEAAARRPVDVVGPICETADFLAQDRPMPPVSRGDLLAVLDAGAYGMSMASQYNSRPRAAEVLVTGGSFRVVRERETIDDLVRGERL